MYNCVVCVTVWKKYVYIYIYMSAEGKVSQNLICSVYSLLWWFLFYLFIFKAPGANY